MIVKIAWIDYDIPLPIPKKSKANSNFIPISRNIACSKLD